MKINISQPDIDQEEIKAVEEVLISGMLTSGPKVAELEKDFASFIGTKFAIATNSGTSALMVALQSLGIGPGDEVITVPFSFIATTNAILYTGAEPVFVDISEKDFNLDPVWLKQALSQRTKAVLVVHLYGQPADLDSILDFTEKHGLLLIEDACQAHGATYKGKKVGSFGTGTFSFYPTKNMTTGEGGMITTDDSELYQRAVMIRNQGQSKRYYHEVLGYNFRMTDIAAAIGLAQFKKLNRNNQRRKLNAEFYLKNLQGIPGIILPLTFPEREHAWHQFTIRVSGQARKSRDELADYLSNKGISTGVYYPLPIHRQKSMIGLKGWGKYPVSEKMAQEVLSLPVHPKLSEEELNYIVERIREACQ